MPIKPDDPVLPFRRQLAAEIVRSLGPHSQFVIAPSFGIRQPRMSELNRGIVARCSIEWLIRRIYRLGGTVSLTVTLGDARQERWLARVRASREAKSVLRNKG
jgi:predicted XRE-type DNA-binding protein